MEEFRFYDGGVSGAYKKMLYKKARQFGRLFIRKVNTTLDLWRRDELTFLEPNEP